MRFGRGGRIQDRLQLFVDPGVPVPVAIQRLTGIGQADLAGAQSPPEAAAVLADFAEGALLVAHGAAFDMGHVGALLPEAFGRRPCLDTLDLVRILLPAAASHSLALLSGELGLVHERPHRALSDADATRQLLGRLVERAEQLPAAVLGTIRRLLAGRSLPLATFFDELVAGGGDALRAEVAGPGRRRQPRPRGGSAVAAEATDSSLADAAAHALGEAGPVARSIAAYELREAQLEMARAVAQTLERSGRLLVEAGPGTGKSLAYLVPAALWSARSGRRTLVATHTITLQEQLAERDLPALVAALDLPVRTAMLKGRRHYLSLRRWRRLLDGLVAAVAPGDLDTLRFALRVLCWLAETTTGDRTELRLSGAEEELWQRVESTVDDCLGPACGAWRDAGCFMVAARRAAADADIVVTNQSLLVADGERQGQVLPGVDAIVVDEAQHLEETATHQLGVRLRAGDVVAIIDRLRGDGGGPLDAALAAARDATLQLFGEVRAFIAAALGVDNPGNAVVALDGGGADAAARRETVLRAATAAQSRLRRAATGALAARGEAPPQGVLLVDAAAVDAELALVADALDAAADGIDRVLLHHRPEQVAWLELRAEQAELRCAPVSVAEPLAERVFDRAGAVVLTSATLTVGGSFDFVAQRTGMRRAAMLRLGSPFDYLSQAVTVLVGDMPAYDAPAYDVALASLVADTAVRLEGRTMVLFTGYAALRSVHRLLAVGLEAERIPVLGQGIDGTRRQVLDGFRQNPRSVLLGTSSFWEGIDISGEALRCVVIAKLPFPVPSDPLVAARAAVLDDPFTELVLPIATLRLKQGFGRLIRHGDARGAVVVCDTRVLSRDYGGRFLAAVPEATMVRAGAAAVGRLVAAFVETGRLPDGARLVAPPAAAAAAADEGAA